MLTLILGGIFKFMLCLRAYDNRIKAIFETQKSTLVHGLTHRDYTPGKGNHFSYTSVEKQIGVNETAISETTFGTGHLSNMSDPLTFHVNSQLFKTSLSFKGIHLLFRLFALLIMLNLVGIF